MHPREALRRHVTDEIRACLPPSAFVSSSLVRDIPAGAGLAAVVFTPSEIIQRVSAIRRSAGFSAGQAHHADFCPGPGFRFGKRRNGDDGGTAASRKAAAD